MRPSACADLVPLSPETEWLGYWFICVSLLVLLVVEVLADLIPAVDHALHTVLAPVHPIAGAVAACAPTYAGGWATHLPMAAAGAGLALAAHGGKSLFRLHSTAATGGAMNPLASLCGTLGTAAAIVLAICVAALSIVLALAVCGLCAYACRQARRVRQRISFRQAGLAVIGAERLRRGGQQHSSQASGQELGVEPPEARTRPLAPGANGAVGANGSAPEEA